jgi:hypothetical protein
MPPDALERAQRILSDIRSNQNYSISELSEIMSGCADALQRIAERESFLIHALRKRSLTETVLDVGSWVAGVAGYLAGCADYYASDGLGLWDWIGLAIGEVGLLATAATYQRRV